MLGAMLALTLSAVSTATASLVAGQFVLWLCGARSFSWVSPAVGSVVLILLCVPAVHLPGRSALCFVLVVGVTVAGLAVMVREPAQRPPMWMAPVAALVGGLAAVPFLSNGHTGTLGVGFDNDMASHLLIVDAYRSSAVAAVNTLPDGYPIGQHAFVAALAQGFGLDSDQAFSGYTLALPVLLAWTATGLLHRVSLPGRLVAGVMTGLPFLVAGYFGQGSFKEILQPTLVLGLAGWLDRPADVRRWLWWVVPGLLIAGVLSIYSAPGMVWPVLLLGAWLGWLAARGIRRDGPRRTARLAVTGARPVVIGAGIALLVLVPQLPRITRFFLDNASDGGTGIEKTNIGNLVGRIPLWAAFGIWDSPDYRVGPNAPLDVGVWIGIALVIALLGVVLLLRRGRVGIVLGALTCLAVWVFADRGQSPYVAAKALVILTPFVMVLVASALLDADVRPATPTRWLGAAALAVAAVLGLRVADGSWDALRFSKVDPRETYRELRALRPELRGGRTLFLGNDDFIRWKLAGVKVDAPVIGLPVLPFRPEKPFVYAQPVDVDSLEPQAVNAYDWVITTRDAAGSALPPQLRLVRRTRLFALYRRTGEVLPRSVAQEGAGAASPLNCRAPAVRALLRDPAAVAAVRRPTLFAPVGPLEPGQTTVATLRLTRGSYAIQTPYNGPRTLRVMAPGLGTVTVPPNLDRPGPRMWVGQLRVTRTTTVPFRLTVLKHRFDAEAFQVGYPVAVEATPADPVTETPLRRSCGKPVDWYAAGPGR